MHNVSAEKFLNIKSHAVDLNMLYESGVAIKKKVSDWNATIAAVPTHA